MDDELDGRIAALEVALTTVIMALEDVPELAIEYRLKHARSRIALHDPSSPRTIAALDAFDRFLPKPDPVAD